MIDLSAPPAEEKAKAPENTRVLKDLTEVEVADVTQEVIAALKTVYDPEIPVDIYELGLIYKVDFDPANDERGAKITVDMTLTAPGCPVAGEMPGWVEDAILKVDGIEEVSVNMTFEPPWSADRMSEEAKLELGWM
ncbi:SUF system Fe-S cluster assembly protein [Parvularcula sp. ZS-1/3]|uniref:SUF system Fe-S cluster assembly protein n=2 Tax=Parvularcula mediterranea TaxID=2732508 RepID=A0A7Y3RQT7_9PROT|nr:SUF system Fe-S cluster assembly protein [Parvularcula mediterranea]